jgi:hypothetical protein
MLSENVPNPVSRESPPLSPHDLPEPAPQAAAWRRALRVIGCDRGRVQPAARTVLAAVGLSSAEIDATFDTARSPRSG